MKMYEDIDIIEMLAIVKDKKSPQNKVDDISGYKTFQQFVSDRSEKKVASWLIWYCDKILKSRWEEIEPLIAKSIFSSLEYAMAVVKGRFPLGEEIIKTNPSTAFFYAIKIMQADYTDFEPTFAKKASVAYWYAVNVTRKRFRAGKAAILADCHFGPHYRARYLFSPNLAV